MNDKSFIKSAVRQSFNQPLITGKEIKISRSGAHSGFVFQSGEGYKLPPTYFSWTDFQKIVRTAERCIMRSPKFFDEYQIFKHLLSENINVPTDNEAARKLQKELKLSALSRSAAQKKKVLSTIISGDFSYNLSHLTPVYKQTVQQLALMEKKYTAATECCQLNEFAVAYRQSLQQFHFSNLMFWFNKKRFLSYLCEAIQILRFQPKLPDDYLETRRFFGETIIPAANLISHCRNRLQYLLAILETMAQKDDLLQNTQALMADPRKYRRLIQQYRNHRAPENFKEINELRQNAKKLFRQYALLTYLDGVRSALEYKLDETPEPRQPALPTVAPDEEIKKIRKLVIESVKTQNTGRLSKIYDDALEQFSKTLQSIRLNLSKSP